MISSILDQVVKIEFSDTGSTIEPCACVITLTNGNDYTGIGSSNVDALENACTWIQKLNGGVARIGFLLKLCEPLPQVDESTLKAREWQINKSEVEDGKR